MCIAIPKKILSIETMDNVRRATVRRGEQNEIVSLAMTPAAQLGDTVLVFQGNALRIVSETEAQQIEAALVCLGQAVDGAMTQDDLRAGFGDLMDHPAQLPPHLQAQVGKKSSLIEAFMNTITKSIAHIDTRTHPCFIRLHQQAGFDVLNENNLEAFLNKEGLKLAVFADDPNSRKETMDIVVIAPELKKAFGDTLSQSVFADFVVARAIAARWGLRSMPAVALFQDRDFLGAIQGLQTWDDYCQKLVTIIQKPQSGPRVIALMSNQDENKA